jgi:uncharacterized membrane protein YbhN (UPF0104 family)
LAVLAVAGVLLFPAVAGIPERLSRACGGWLTLAGGLELLSAAGYVAVFGLMFCGGMAWRPSSRVACGSLAAGTLVPAGGVAGPALGALYARTRGAPTPSIASRVTAFFVLTNAPNLVALAGLGLALWSGLLSGPRSPALTVVPAAIALGLLALIAVASAAAHRLCAPRPTNRPWGAIAGLRALATGAHEAVTLIRGRNWRLVGAVASYGFDNAALWASFRAFGHSPALSVIVMAFLVGGLGNALPLPAGVGGTEVGLFGTLVLYGAGAGPSAVAVLAYRVVSTGVPLVLGGIALRGLHLSLADPSDAIRPCAPTDGHRFGRRTSASERPRPARRRGRASVARRP